VPTLETLVTEADLILSILVPAEAVKLAQQVAEALKATETNTFFADCNAISPQTTERINTIITAAGGRYIDASIIGSPPGKGEAPRFYASGAYARIMSELDGKGIVVRPLGDAIGRASGIKMCYAALTKGSAALYVALLTAAEALGLSEELRTELQESQAATYKRMEAQIPSLSAKAFRWVGEMEEIAATFEQVGVTPHFHYGAAEIYRLFGDTPFAHETPETIDQNRTLAQTIAILAQALPSRVEE
jgi:3-hydroxyisobutyrate dehydrogenase-like beta-hydroxyacid dehydrogenase